MNDTITTTVPAAKHKGGGSFNVVLGPPTSIFDAVILEEGLKRNRKNEIDELFIIILFIFFILYSLYYYYYILFIILMSIALSF